MYNAGSTFNRNHERVVPRMTVRKEIDIVTGREPYDPFGN